VYPCAGEDRWIAIAVASDEEWRALVRAMGEPAWAREPELASAAGRLAREAELDARLAAFTRGFEPGPLMQELQAAGVPAGAVQSVADLLADPQLAHRGHFRWLRHPHLGELPFEHSGFRIEGSPPVLSAPGPNLGEHNAEVLGGILGLSAAEIARLVAQEVVA
jgi:benzylsuccinate CoA-transferase BbsF subunit